MLTAVGFHFFFFFLLEILSLPISTNAGSSLLFQSSLKKSFDLDVGYGYGDYIGFIVTSIVGFIYVLYNLICVSFTY